MLSLDTTQSDVYALDGYGPIQHVVTALVGAQSALTLLELAKGYKHHSSGDLNRVKNHEKLSTDAEATRWLISWALTQLGSEQVEEVKGKHYQLRVPLKDIRWGERGVQLAREDVRVFPGGNEPFSQMSGKFNVNIRAPGQDDLTELTELMRDGWDKRLGLAIIDEHGAVLVGHRRLKVAEQLGIKPYVETIKFGQGTKADVDRMLLAIRSNAGFKPMTKRDREQLAQYFCGKPEWSTQAIVEVLKKAGHVDKRTAYRDVEKAKAVGSDNCHTGVASQEAENPAPIPVKGATARRRTKSDDVRELIERKIAEGTSFEDIGVDDLVAETNYARTTVQVGLAEVRGVLEGRAREQAERKQAERKQAEPAQAEPAQAEPAPSEHEHEHVWGCLLCGATPP